MTKLTRKQIKEGLDQVPIDILLTGTKNNRLTHKQKEFARNVAQGETGADAYRKAYRSKGKPKTVGNNASKLMQNDGIKLEIVAIKQAIEFNKSHSSAQLRALVVSQLTKEALNGENPPASRLTALKALGEVAGVDAFIHRTETKIIKDSETSRAELMEQLKKAISDNMRTINADDSDPMDLLREIADGAKGNQDAATPPTPDPHNLAEPLADYMHSIPHNQSPKNDESHLTQVSDTETPPVTVWK